MRTRAVLLVAVLTALFGTTLLPQESTPGLFQRSVVDQVSSCLEPSGIARIGREKVAEQRSCDGSDAGETGGVVQALVLLVLLALTRALRRDGNPTGVPRPRRGRVCAGPERRVALRRGPPLVG